MKTIRHRLRGIDPILHLLNDDGRPGITIVVHGAAPGHCLTERPACDSLRCSISQAQLTGRIYLLSWRSGFRSGIYALSDYHCVEENAHRLGNNLRAIVDKIPRKTGHRLRLIGHSLGGHVIVSALFTGQWKALNVGDVLLLGTALSEDDFKDHTPVKMWRQCLSQIRGTIFNLYNRYDYSLHLRRFSRGFQSESIGRSKSSHFSNRIRNVSFTGRLPDDYGHAYCDVFTRVIDRVYPTRRRSRDYPIEAECDCPNCDESLIVTADVEVDCPECGVTFEYRNENATCYWAHELMECPSCEGPTGILIQESGSYICPDCRKKTAFECVGRSIRLV